MRPGLARPDAGPAVEWRCVCGTVFRSYEQYQGHLAGCEAARKLGAVLIRPAAGGLS